jgi:hypothetical protein
MCRTFKVLEEERTVSHWDDMMDGETIDGVCMVSVYALLPTFTGSVAVDVYYKPGHAKHGHETEESLRKRFPLSYPK